jgi:hypothetical protein
MARAKTTYVGKRIELTRQKNGLVFIGVRHDVDSGSVVERCDVQADCALPQLMRMKSKKRTVPTRQRTAREGEQTSARAARFKRTY